MMRVNCAFDTQPRFLDIWSWDGSTQPTVTIDMPDVTDSNSLSEYHPVFGP